MATNDENLKVYHIEMNPMDGAITDVTLNYNGEWAFVIRVENCIMPERREGDPEPDPKTVEVAKATITAAPINGGEGQQASIILTLEGEPSA